MRQSGQNSIRNQARRSFPSGESTPPRKPARRNGHSNEKKESSMSMSSVQTSTHEVANYGGLIDAIGGAAAVVLAIIGLSGTNSNMLLAITTIVFGAALLIQSGAIVSELTHMTLPSAAESSSDEFSAGGLSIVFLVGTAGIVLGVLALIGIYTVELTSIAVIAFG